jgi:hypothetical protein
MLGLLDWEDTLPPRGIFQDHRCELCEAHICMTNKAHLSHIFPQAVSKPGNMTFSLFGCPISKQSEALGDALFIPKPYEHLCRRFKVKNSRRLLHWTDPWSCQSLLTQIGRRLQVSERCQIGPEVWLQDSSNSNLQKRV